jgi:hypothetical protein
MMANLIKISSLRGRKDEVICQKSIRLPQQIKNLLRNDLRNGFALGITQEILFVWHEQKDCKETFMFMDSKSQIETNE